MSADLAVFFYNVLGRKAWRFHQDFVSSSEESSGDDWPCTVEGMTADEHGRSLTCVVGEGDMLFAPRGPEWPGGWYHSTCHLSSTSATLIQWDEDAMRQQDGAELEEEEERRSK